jgi:DNA-binding NarL/FixJ family response regulator
MTPAASAPHDVTGRKSDRTIRILLAEDHATVRHALRLLLQAEDDLTIVDEVSTGRDAVRSAHASAPDVILLDISMPELDGLEATREILAATPNTGIVILTRHSDSAYVAALLAAGVRGYVVKQSTSETLLRAIRHVAAGGQFVDPALPRIVVAEQRVRTPRGAIVSDRELEVLRSIAAGQTNKEIAADLGLSVKTVEAHKANVMRKLDLRGRVDVVRYAVSRGWLKDI